MSRGDAGSLATLAALLACSACHPNATVTGRAPTRTTAPATTAIRSCSYRVELSAEGRASVDASCQTAGPLSFRVARPSLASNVTSRTPGQDGQYPSTGNRLSYVVDLAKLAGRGHDFDSAARMGASFIAPMSSVLLVPEPLTTDIAVAVEVVAPPSLAVAVGLARAERPNTYRLMAHEIPVATYFTFGKLTQRTLDIDGAHLEVTQLDGALDQSFDDLNAWIETSARAVRDFYRVFPVPRASVTVIPIPTRDSVVFGKVMPESEPGVALLVGQHAKRKALYSDWILVHELFHLGVPSFLEEGKWLDEGLATYYEPIIRVRAGLYTETEMWTEFSTSMPQGLPAFEKRGLEKADDRASIYWGGALACLVADVEARKRDSSRGLEVGLRALREAGGNASEVWSLSEVVGTVDRALAAPTLTPIVKDHVRRGTPFDLPGLFAALGVIRKGKGVVQLSESAPLAAVRRAITAKP
jgi:hypothetical protein